MGGAIDAALETVTIGGIPGNKLSKACEIKEMLSMKHG
jgi:hypothetical protein